MHSGCQIEQVQIIRPDIIGGEAGHDDFIYLAQALIYRFGRLAECFCLLFSVLGGFKLCVGPVLPLELIFRPLN